MAVGADDQGLTRGDLLKLRGYDEATIAGNGHVPLAPAPESNGRTCDVCGTPLVRGQRRFCSVRCRNAVGRQASIEQMARHLPPPDDLAAVVGLLLDGGLRVQLEVGRVHLEVVKR